MTSWTKTCLLVPLLVAFIISFTTSWMSFVVVVENTKTNKRIDKMRNFHDSISTDRDNNNFHEINKTSSSKMSDSNKIDQLIPNNFDDLKFCAGRKIGNYKFTTSSLLSNDKSTTKEKEEEEDVIKPIFIEELQDKKIIAILVATKSSPTYTDVSQSSLQKLLISSIDQTTTEIEKSSWRIRLYIAIDSDDLFWINNHKAIQAPDWLEVHTYIFPKTEKFRIPFNEIAMKAYEDGSEYFIRLNDDTEFITKGWLSMGIETLSSFDPPNVGVVGPSCHEGNVMIMTHDMVHRTHLIIFEGKYYPTIFRNWYVDDWITNVYAQRNIGINRSIKRKDWVVKHHLHQTRYNPDTTLGRYLPTEYRLGREKIMAYIDSIKINQVTDAHTSSSNNDFVIVITVNDGYYDFFVNWYAFYEKLNLKLPLIIIAEDDIIYTKIEDLKLPLTYLERSNSIIGSKDFSYATEEYLKFVSNRATYLLDILCTEKDIIYVDIDTVWRKDPLPYFNFENNDMLIQVDIDSHENLSPWYCTGLMVIKSNERTRELMMLWEEKLVHKPQLNQPIFNRLVHSQSKVQHKGLPIAYFQSGHYYFGVHGSSQRESAVTVHNNYIIGHDKKKDRFKKYNLWLADSFHTESSYDKS